MWRHVAADLAADHTVICPDLRGYGASDKPVDTDGERYAKRTMAADVVALARALGHERFALAGHDRGALVAVRAGLDHPDAVTHLAALDVLPTLDMWDVLHGTTAAVGFHLYLMAQPPGLPEQLISGSPDAFFGHFLDVWTRDPAALPADVRGRVPGGVPGGDPLDRGRLPGVGRDRRRARSDRPVGREPAADAGDRAPAGLGRRSRLRRGRAVAGLGTGSGAPHRLLRPLHGGGGAGRDRRGAARAAGPVAAARGRAARRTTRIFCRACRLAPAPFVVRT
ncbi:alpha/beta fold hydrolase [Micromonospora musae]|uniref:alpha/beta fold hydrolase n=1 Tax=Micromonospora musae TaxID=1894970 RepID=UPI0033FB800E